MQFDISDPPKRRFNGYGRKRIPDPLDDEVRDFIDQLCRGGPPAVAGAIAHASEHGRGVLRAYAERMASLAVRRRDASLLVRALVANVVGGLDTNDHEALMQMPLIEHSARKI